MSGLGRLEIGVRTYGGFDWVSELDDVEGSEGEAESNTDEVSEKEDERSMVASEGAEGESGTEDVACECFEAAVCESFKPLLHSIISTEEASESEDEEEEEPACLNGLNEIFKEKIAGESKSPAEDLKKRPMIGDKAFVYKVAANSFVGEIPEELKDQFLAIKVYKKPLPNMPDKSEQAIAGIPTKELTHVLQQRGFLLLDTSTNRYRWEWKKDVFKLTPGYQIAAVAYNYVANGFGGNRVSRACSAFSYQSREEGSVGYRGKREDEEASFRYTPQEIQNIISSILHTLITLNSYGYMHADLKPDAFANMNDGSVKIVDFDTVQKPCESLSPKDVPGTGKYMAPETIFRNSINLKSDIWALGCILFDLCSNPFVDSTVDANDKRREFYQNVFKEQDKLFYINRQTKKFEELTKDAPILTRRFDQNTAECIANLIKLCLVLDPEKRATPEILLGMISTNPFSKASPLGSPLLGEEDTAKGDGGKEKPDVSVEKGAGRPRAYTL